MSENYHTRWKQVDFKGWKYEKLIGLSLQKKVFDVYPHLKKYPELSSKLIDTKHLSFDKVLRYVMIYYSDNILRYTIPETMRRKREAAFLAGFNLTPSTKRFNELIENMLMCKESSINRMIVRFLRRSENKKFLQICVFEEARAKQMQKLIDGIGEKEKELTKVVIDNVKTLSDDIERLERELLNEDENEDLLDMLYDEVDYSNLGLSPEEIAELQRKNELKEVLKSPYKSKYDPYAKKR